MFKQLRPALVSVLCFTILTGLLFPAVVTAVGKVAFAEQAGGGLIYKEGKVVGAALIGQSFAGARYFHPRPSAAGGAPSGSGYDAANSSGTNLGPTSRKLLQGAEGFDGVAQLAAKYRQENGLAATAILPPDAVTRSASGLDPHISPENAALQAARVAKARGVALNKVQELVKQHTQERQFGLLGEPRVNVLQLNLALDALK